MNSAPIFVRPATFGQTSKLHNFERSGRRSTSIFNTAGSNGALLSDSAVTSQQLIITSNKFRADRHERGCVRLLAVLSTLCSAAVSRRSAEVVGVEKKKKQWAIN
jgi:hypothetical protein